MAFKGINLGGWLMMEGYILGGRNIPETQFKNAFTKVNGKRGLAEFEGSFRDNFIQESDFANISSMGFDVIRLPFHHAVPLVYLHRAADWAGKYGLKLILDLHGAPGAQNYDWHSDSNGKALLWVNKRNQQKVFELWERLADEFKDHPAVLGYDLLNEPVIHSKDAAKTIIAFYQTIIKKIRAIDKHKIIYLEGNIWAQQIDFLSALIAENIHISVHSYRPEESVFNLIPGSVFPGQSSDGFWDPAAVKKHLEKYYDFAVKNKTRIFLGEFGVNWRNDLCGETKWLKAMLDAMRDFDFDWAYWTYKAVGGYHFPDGLLRHSENGSFVRRTEIVKGFETYIPAWRKEKQVIIKFWQSTNFRPVGPLMNILTK